jgi:putative acetyltransferase
MVNVTRAETAEEIELARGLFREYALTPGVSECVAGFKQEVAGLPGRYKMLLLGFVDGEAMGCAALRALEGDVCEMKRLYVRAAARGTGLGKRLAEALMDEARGMGFRRMRLDTLPSMGAAHGLYRSLGFVEIGQYSEGAPAEALFFERNLEL